MNQTMDQTDVLLSISWKLATVQRCCCWQASHSMLFSDYTKFSRLFTWRISAISHHLVHLHCCWLCGWSLGRCSSPMICSSSRGFSRRMTHCSRPPCLSDRDLTCHSSASPVCCSCWSTPSSPDERYFLMYFLMWFFPSRQFNDTSHNNNN